MARLTVLSAASVVQAINADTRCGFASDEAARSTELDGQPGQIGAATTSVKGCTLDFGELHEVTKDCNGVATQLGGRITVSGTRVIRGQLTGLAATPIVPVAPDATELELSVSFDDFEVARDGVSERLLHREGKLSFIAEPHLARSRTLGMCTVPTSDLTLRALRYEDARVQLTAKGTRLDVELPSSAFDAQIGRWKKAENTLAGKVTVWDSLQTVPEAGDRDWLDPDYDAKTFAASYACTDDLLQPVDFTCPTLAPRLAQGAGALTVGAFLNLASHFDDDATCGFASPEVLARPVVTGDVGERVGSALYTVREPCTLRFPKPTPVRTDCAGVTTYFQGTVTLTGTKRVRGIRTGHPEFPIVPITRDPAEVEVTANFTDFTVSDSLGERSLTFTRGSLSGMASPRTAIDLSTGACSLKTPVAQVSTLRYRNTKVVLEVGGARFDLEIPSSHLEAQTGTKGPRTNHLSGDITLNGEAVTLPPRGEPAILDPAYDAATFEHDFAACRPEMKVVREPSECAFYEPLAAGVARLIVQNVGAVAELINANSQCGFADKMNQLQPTEVIGTPPQMGSMTWSIDSCRVGNAAVEQTAVSCTGGESFQGGRAVVSARRKVTGERGRLEIFGIPTPINTIAPRTSTAAQVFLDGVQLEEFVAYSKAPGAAEPAGKLTLHTGKLKGTVLPVLGERLSSDGLFDIATPVARLQDIELTGADATLESGGMTFHLPIPRARLQAFNGTFGGRSNELFGEVTLGDQTLTLPPMPLDPSFEQRAFDQSYACTPDLKSVVAP